MKFRSQPYLFLARGQTWCGFPPKKPNVFMFARLGAWLCLFAHNLPNKVFLWLKAIFSQRIKILLKNIPKKIILPAFGQNVLIQRWVMLGRGEGRDGMLRDMNRYSSLIRIVPICKICGLIHCDIWWVDMSSFFLSNSQGNSTYQKCFIWNLELQGKRFGDSNRVDRCFFWQQWWDVVYLKHPKLAAWHIFLVEKQAFLRRKGQRFFSLGIKRHFCKWKFLV